MRSAPGATMAAALRWVKAPPPPHGMLATNENPTGEPAMNAEDFPFEDRADAGRRLAARLAAMAPENPVVYALPRGGVPVAVEIAHALGAPLDLVMVRKIGAPGAPEVAAAAVVEGDPPRTIVNEEVMRAAGADAAWFERARARELAELRRRRARYLGERPRISPAGRTAIVVDDGLATGATMKAALAALRAQGAARVIVAVPVAPAEQIPQLARLADDVVCLLPARHFRGVGCFYRDFHQLTDEETVGLLRSVWAEAAEDPAGPILRREITVPPAGLAGELSVPADPRGVVIFAHGSGSSRFSPRNRAVAEHLNRLGFATLLLDLLTPAEAEDRRNVFDIPLLAERLLEAELRVAAEPGMAELPLGLFGASTGAGAALLAAAELGERVSAVVSRGGRPDLAGPRLAEVTAPTLLIVGGNDPQTLALNRRALAELRCEKLLRIIPGAGHVFEEPGALEQVAQLAGAWFQHHLGRAADAAAPAPSGADVRPAAPRDPVAILRQAAEPLPEIEDDAFAAAFDRFADARVVLLGESTHGTSEFYRARDRITRRLIERHGFNIVAVEADWPDAAAIDRHVRGLPARGRNVAPFARFPTWMWRNKEVDAFVAWLRRRNAALAPEARARFCGLDLYSMFTSMAEVLAYLDRVDPEAAAAARRRYGCLAPWASEPAAYGRAALAAGHAACEEPVMRVLTELMRKRLDYARQDGDQFFDAERNAQLVADAERYYRVMYYGARESWNLRDRHMFETLRATLAHVGPEAKAVVWAHNSHIGDARATEMGAARGELNIGQLCREEWGREVALIGLCADRGTVAAATDWDGPMEIKAMRPSRPDSHEALLREAGGARCLLDLRAGVNEAARAVLAEPRLERFIGVIYRPETERWSHYSHALMSEQFDALLWFAEGSAVTPLPARVQGGEDDTYPFGL
ncbi:erythromycin esterase-like protein [Oceanicella actignis]|nr:erythromycin esterase-like protein [Oceanicella actignis]